MTNAEFREWLKGFFELSNDNVTLSSHQLQIIVNHLNLAEAVTGRLDELNGHLRAEITVFRRKFEKSDEDLALLTQSMRQQVINA